MVDTLLSLRDQARALAAPEAHGVAGGAYAFCTFHRPSNVDQPGTLAEILGSLDDLAARMPVLFAIHPRTRARIAEFGLEHLARRVTPARAAELPGDHLPARPCRPGADRLGRPAGGDHRAGGAVPDRPAQHRAAGHHHRGHQPADSHRADAGSTPRWRRCSAGGATGDSRPAGLRAGMAGPGNGSFAAWRGPDPTRISRSHLHFRRCAARRASPRSLQTRPGGLRSPNV